MKRPVEKMLRPKSMHEYSDYVLRYNFIPMNRELGFDPLEFYREWSQLTAKARAETRYNVVNPATECDPPIYVAEGENAVKLAVSDLSVIVDAATESLGDFPYLPAWDFLAYTYTEPYSRTMQLSVKRVIEYLEIANQRFGLFEILKNQKLRLDIILVDDIDVTPGIADGSLTMPKKRTGNLNMLRSFFQRSHLATINIMYIRHFSRFFPRCCIHCCSAASLRIQFVRPSGIN